MFENKFNTRKTDSLVEAVKVAQQEGDLRRQAEAAVNEAFGVYNRNAVIRENLVAYDAALEEAYKCMKEGEKWEGSKKDTDEDKKLAKKHGMTLAQWEKSEADKKHDAKEKMDEGNDGNLANNYPPYDKVTRGDVIAGRLGKDQMGGKKKVNEKKMYEADMDPSVQGGSDVTKDSKPVVSPSASKVNTSGPSAADKAGLAAKIGAMKEAKLDEISTKLATRYTKKSFKDMKQAADFGDTMSIRNRAKGIGMASKKLTGGAKVPANEETLDEAVSRKHFQQVADLIKGHESQEKRNELASHHAGIFAKQNPRFDHARFHKAAGSTAHEAKTVKESVLAAIRAKHMKEDQGF